MNVKTCTYVTCRYGNEPNYDEMTNSAGKRILLLTIHNAQYGVTTVSMIFTNIVLQGFFSGSCGQVWKQ
jgi:hypothetical protein